MSLILLVSWWHLNSGCTLNTLQVSVWNFKTYRFLLQLEGAISSASLLPPHLFPVWQRPYGLDMSGPEILIYCDNKSRKLSRFLYIIGIDFKLILGKLKLHLFCKCIVSLNTLRPVCVIASICEAKLNKNIWTHTSEIPSQSDLWRHTSNLKCSGWRSYVSGAYHHSMHAVKLNL